MNPEQILTEAFYRGLGIYLGAIGDKPLPELQAWKNALVEMTVSYQNAINALENNP